LRPGAVGKPRACVLADEDPAFLAEQFVDLAVERATRGGLRGVVEDVDPGLPGPYGDVEPVTVGQEDQIGGLELRRAAPAGLKRVNCTTVTCSSGASARPVTPLSGRPIPVTAQAGGPARGMTPASLWRRQ